MEYIVEDKYKEMVQTIKAHTTAALREKVVKAIIVSVLTDMLSPPGPPVFTIKSLNDVICKHLFA